VLTTRSEAGVDTEEIWTAIERERLRTADMLASLSPSDWDTPSLCAGWRVRDVAAHLSLAARVRPFAAFVGLVRSGGNFNRYVATDARGRADRPPAELVDELRSIAARRQRPPGTKPVDPLVDILVHTLDVTVPLSVEWAVPAEAVAAADRVWSMGFPFRARRRFEGRTIRATNADWSRGSGPGLVGPMEVVLLALTGREAGIEALRPADPGAAS
jgi:uncharacterized protein (TIGR03083 family)